MDTIIRVSARRVYGSVLLYPANGQATRLAERVGTKTLTLDVLARAQAMGFAVDVVGDLCDAIDADEVRSVLARLTPNTGE